MSTDLRCADCGERIRAGRVPGTWTHVARLVASCDLDSDHRPTPAEPVQPAGSSATVTTTRADSVTGSGTSSPMSSGSMPIDASE